MGVAQDCKPLGKGYHESMSQFLSPEQFLYQIIILRYKCFTLIGCYFLKLQ
jgi:hypothetical protein